MKPQLDFKINNYSIVRKDRSDGKSGVAIFIKYNLYYSYKSNNQFKDIEYIHVELYCNDTKLNIVNLYNPPSNIINKDVYSNFFSYKNIIICGDFNSKNNLWGSSSSDKNGKLLLQLIQDHDLNILNDGSGTHLSYLGKVTPLDLTFIAKQYCSKTKWQVLDNTFGSDHYVIQITILNQKEKQENSAIIKWNYKKANWNKFNNHFESSFGNLNLIDNDNMQINMFNNKIISVIKDAADLYIPKCKPFNKNMVPYWNEECNLAIKERKKARRKVMRSKLPQDWLDYKKKKALAQRIIKQSKKIFCKNYCKSLNKDSNLTKVWNLIKRFNNNDLFSGYNFPTLSLNNQDYVENTQKAEILAKTFQSVSEEANYNKTFIKNKSIFLQKYKYLNEQILVENSILDENFTLN